MSLLAFYSPQSSPKTAAILTSYNAFKLAAFIIQMATPTRPTRPTRPTPHAQSLPPRPPASLAKYTTPIGASVLRALPSEQPTAPPSAQPTTMTDRAVPAVPPLTPTA